MFTGLAMLLTESGKSADSPSRKKQRTSEEMELDENIDALPNNARESAVSSLSIYYFDLRRILVLNILTTQLTSSCIHGGELWKRPWNN